MSGQHAYVCVLFSLYHKMHPSGATEMHQMHAFIQTRVVFRTCKCIFMDWACHWGWMLYSVPLSSHYLWGFSCFLPFHLYIAWICTLTEAALRFAAAVIWCSTSQLFVKCENVEKGSGWLTCNMCLMHLSLHSQLGAAYVSATTGAVVTALGLKSLATVKHVVQVHKQIK